MIRHLWWRLVWEGRFKALLAQAVELQCASLVVFLGNDRFHVVGYDYSGVYARDNQGYVGHITWKDLNEAGRYLGRVTYENWQVDLDLWADSHLRDQTEHRIDGLKRLAGQLDQFVMVQPRYHKAQFMTTQYTLIHGSRIPGRDANLVWFLSDYSTYQARLRAFLPFEIDLVIPQ